MTLRRCDEGPRQAGREERHRLAQRLGLKLRVRLPPRAILPGLRVVGRLTGVRRMRALLTLCLMRLRMQRRPHRPLYVMERGSSAPAPTCAAEMHLRWSLLADLRDRSRRPHLGRRKQLRPLACELLQRPTSTPRRRRRNDLPRSDGQPPLRLVQVRQHRPRESVRSETGPETTLDAAIARVWTPSQGSPTNGLHKARGHVGGGTRTWAAAVALERRPPAARDEGQAMPRLVPVMLSAALHVILAVFLNGGLERDLNGVLEGVLEGVFKVVLEHVLVQGLALDLAPSRRPSDPRDALGARAHGGHLHRLPLLDQPMRRGSSHCVT